VAGRSSGKIDLALPSFGWVFAEAGDRARARERGWKNVTGCTLICSPVTIHKFTPDNGTVGDESF
jgi:hypothetical protein